MKEFTVQCRIAIRNAIGDLYRNRGITDYELIDNVVDKVVYTLSHSEPRTVIVDGKELNGYIDPLAWLYTRYEPVERENKKYTLCKDAWIVLFTDGETAKLLTEHVHVLEPNGWGDEEDWIKEDNTHTVTTSRDMDGIFDMLYS